ESHLARPINRHRIVIGNGAIRVTFADAAIRGSKFGAYLQDGSPTEFPDMKPWEVAVARKVLTAARISPRN
ncbi:hypothetical protein, partial [Bradyrhizobium sp. R2.2-H]